MAFRLADNVQETATCTGTTGDILLAGAVAGFAAASAKHADLDVVLYGMLQGSGPPIEEYGYGIYRTGPSRIVRSGAGTLVFRSTNGGAPVNWGAGTINVVCCGSGHLFEQLFDPAATTGLLVNTGWRTFARRTLTGTAKLPVIDGSGVAGNPTLDQSWLDSTPVYRTSGASAAERTMGGRLILDATATILKGLAASLHKFYRDDALTDQIGEWFTNGANDWRLRMNIAGSLRRLIHASASDQNDADLLSGSTIAQVRKLSFFPGGNLYKSGALGISDKGVHTLAHALGQMPSHVWAQLICLTGEHGFTAGRRIDIGSGLADTTGPQGHVVEMDSTNLYVKFASATNVYEVLVQAAAGSGGTTIQLTNANWNVEFFALA